MKSTILSAICCMLMFCACHDEKEQWPRETGRAVLVYMAADNNLDNEVRSDLSEMIEGSKMLGDEAKLIALVDRRRERPYILEIANGDTIRRETFDEELSTSSAETLRTAMRWLTDHYQAKSYGLVLWGHADGWIIYDDQPQQEAQGLRHRLHGGLYVDEHHGHGAGAGGLSPPDVYLCRLLRLHERRVDV